MMTLRRAAIPALILLGLAAAAPAQEMSVSFGAGGFLSSESAYRQIYGSGFALAGDVWLKLKGPIGFASGFGWLSDKGTAVPVEGSGDEYALDLRRSSVPVIVFYEIGGNKVGIRLGAGIGIHSYKETWQTVELGFKGHKVSPRFLVAASFALFDKLSLLCSITYDSIPTKTGSLLDAAIDLGGFQFLGGFAFRIF
jgi:hypothetical protein